MGLRWERSHSSLFRGFDADGRERAQVGHMAGPDGTDFGWVVWLPDGGELPRRYAGAEAALAAAEAAVDPGENPDG